MTDVAKTSQEARTCANGPDEYGAWPCDPRGYFGVAECHGSLLTAYEEAVRERDDAHQRLDELNAARIDRDDRVWLLRERIDHLVVAHLRYMRGYNAKTNSNIDNAARAEAAEKQIERLREAMRQARRDLWWFIENDTGDDWIGDPAQIAMRAIDIQDKVLGDALADSNATGGER